MSNPAQGMPCPVDGTALVMSERSGIEIDYCPTCRGVWLDRGERDKIIEREQGERREQHRDEQRYDRRYEDKAYKPKKKESFFERFMDFD